jgi:hypothetical protein
VIKEFKGEKKTHNKPYPFIPHSWGMFALYAISIVKYY